MDKKSKGDYWAVRASYPTGRFSPRWLHEASKRDRLVPRGLPRGWYPSLAESLLTLDPNAFTSLGPAPLQMDGCQSCFAYGHATGRISVVVAHPSNPAIAYVGSDGGGVWKTTNCCSVNTTFTPITDDVAGISSISIGDLYIDPTDPTGETVYVGTGDLRYGSWSFGSSGVYRTRDGGSSWEVLGAEIFNPVYNQGTGVYPQYQAIGKVRTDPNHGTTVIVGTKQGIYFSYDDGVNWTGPCYTNNFTTQRQDTTGLIVRDDGTTTTLYAAIGTRGVATGVQPDLDKTGANGVYRTTVPDPNTVGCPASWTLLNTGWPSSVGDGVPDGDIGRLDLSISASDPQTLYAVAADASTLGVYGVFRTTDGGNTWTQRSTSTGWSGCDDYGSQSWYDQNIAVHPGDPNMVFMSQIDVHRSVNGGTTFPNITCGYSTGDLVHVDNHGLAFTVNGGLIATSDGGAYYCPDPTDATSGGCDSDSGWINMNNSGLNITEFYSGDITNNFATSANPGINAGAQDNGSMTHVWSGNPGPAMWQVRTGGDGMHARIEQKQGNYWFQESQNGGLKRSTTGASGFYSSISGSWTGDTLSFVMPYEIDRFHCPGAICDHMILGTNRVWESTSSGSSWVANSPNLTKGTLGNRSFINQLQYGHGNNTIAIAGTNDGNVYYGFNMGQGVTNSATWVNVTGSNSVLPNRPVLDVVTSPTNPLVGYAALGGFDENSPSTPGHVYEVTCSANCASFNWVDKSGNLPNIPADSIVVNPNIPAQVFLGTDWGLYFTDDISAQPVVWQKFTAGLPSVMIWDMAIDRNATTLALFTRSRGAYVWPLPGAGAPSPTPNVTSTPTATRTPTRTPTFTSTPTSTLASTATPTFAPSDTPTLTATETPQQPTQTSTVTSTFTALATPTPTEALTSTPTFTPLSSPTSSPLPSGTPTQSPTSSPTSTATQTPSATPALPGEPSVLFGLMLLLTVALASYVRRAKPF